MRVTPVDRIDPPSLETFMNTYAQAGNSSRPVVLKGAASKWPAMQWDLNVLKEKCGDRLLVRPCQGNNDVLKVFDERLMGTKWASMKAVSATSTNQRTGSLTSSLTSR